MSSIALPFFVFAVNKLSLALQDALKDNHLTCISLGTNCPPIHSMMFADDLIVCVANLTCWKLKLYLKFLTIFVSTLDEFQNGVNLQVKEDIRRVFTGPHIDNSFTHLGHLSFFLPKIDWLLIPLFMKNSNPSSSLLWQTESHMQPV
jgi:hypothetical protein